MKLNYKRTIFVGFAFFLICAFWQAYDSIVPMMLVNKFGLSQTASGAIMAIDNVLAVVLLPIFGAISDKTKTKFGKRTPYIFIGTIIAVCAFIGMTFADNVQLNKLYEGKDTASYTQSIWEENLSIKYLEEDYELSGDENITVKDYVSKIFFNKNYESLTDAEKITAKDKFIEISSNNKIMYDYSNGVFTVGENAKNSVYSNVFVSARTAHAWQVTKSSPAPLVIFISVLLVTLLAMAIFRSPAVALMPDVTIKPLRSKANAVINLLGTAGGILVLVLGMIFKTGDVSNQMMSYTLFVTAVCSIMVVGLVLFLSKVRENKWVSEMESEQAKLDAQVENSEEQTSGEKISKGKLISLILILASVALWYMGYNAVTSKYSLYATNVLGKDYNSTLLIAQAAAIISYIPVGFIASKFGRKKTILVGVLVLGTAFLSAIFANSKTPTVIMYVIFALAGIGWATINVNSFPMVVELAKGENVGRYTGFYYTASMAAQTITPVFSGVIMDLVGNMSPLFPYATFFVLASFLTMLFVKYGDNKPTLSQSVMESLNND